MAKILLVEDVEEVRVVLCQAIEMAGHDAHCVATYGDAEGAVASGEYALVVTDARLPDGSGKALAELAGRTGMRAVLISGDPDELQALAVKREISLLQKPFRLDELTRAVEHHLGA